METEPEAYRYMGA